MLYEEEAQGLDGPKKISTRWPARYHVTCPVRVAELKETAQYCPKWPPLLTVSVKTECFLEPVTLL